MSNQRIVGIAATTLLAYQILDMDGVWELVSTGQNNEILKQDRKPREDGQEDKLANNPDFVKSILMNFEAVDVRKAPALIEAMEGKETVEFDDLKSIPFTHEILIFKDTKNQSPVLPMKGETVTVNLAYAKDADEADGLRKDEQGKAILNVTDWQLNRQVRRNTLASMQAVAAPVRELED